MQGLEQHVEHLGNSFASEALFSSETLRSLSGSELTNKAEKPKLKGETTTIITILKKTHYCGLKVYKMCTQLQAPAHWLTGICVVIPYGVS